MPDASYDSSHKFLTLDALRGVAAIAVVQYHWTHPIVPDARRSHAYLAVDFFFLLSGFVISFAYQQRLNAGWSTTGFLKARLIRLYPLYILGSFLGLIAALLHSKFGFSLEPYAMLLGFALFMLPTPFVPQQAYGAAFPLNFPAWSLFLEVVANVVHALALRRRGWRVLLASLAAWGVMLLYAVKRFGKLEMGFTTGALPLAVSRALFSYTLGMLLYVVWTRKAIWLPRIPFLVVPAVLIAILKFRPAAHISIYSDLLMIGCVFPLLLLLGAASPPPRSLTRVAVLLGRSSYAIYMLHVPLESFQALVWERLRHRTLAADQPLARGVGMVVLIALALAVDRLYDVPVRAYLRTRLGWSSAAKPLPVTPESSAV